MAIGPRIFQEQYEKLTVEELEKKYSNLIVYIGFTNKENRIRFLAENILNSSISNFYTEKMVLEEILKKKTGKDYSNQYIESNIKIGTNDIINYISEGDNSKVKILKKVLNLLYIGLIFRKKIERIKKEFLLLLYNDKKSYKDFFNEASNTSNYVFLFIKYYLKLYEFKKQNSYIC